MGEFDGADYLDLFPSPFLSYQWPDCAEFNKDLRTRILAYERENPESGVKQSQVGGWHSRAGQLEFLREPGRALLERMTRLVNEATRRALAGRQVPEFTWQVEAWVNVNRQGDFNRSHLHGMSTWSSTYYVDDGDPPPDQEFGTALEITDPMALRSSAFFHGILGLGLFVKPVPGLTVIFPSYVPHQVMPHRGKRPRISVAFNYRKSPFP